MEKDMSIFKSIRHISLIKKTPKLPNMYSTPPQISLWSLHKAKHLLEREAQLINPWDMPHSHTLTACFGKASEREFQHNDDDQKKKNAPKQTPTIIHPTCLVLLSSDLD